MAFKDFTINGHGWFDKQATADSPGQRGILSGLGRTLSGVAAPYAAAYQGGTGYDQQRLQQQQDMADIEFQKYLAQKNIESQGLGIKKQEAGTNNAMMAAWLHSQGIDPNTIMGGGQQNSPLPNSPIGQSTQPQGQLQNQPIQPPSGAMMSLANGGFGDAQGNPIMSQAQPQDLQKGNVQPNGVNPFASMTPSFSGGKFSLKGNSQMLNPEQANALGQQLADGTLSPSQLQGRGLSRTQALLAAKQINPNYNAAQADINYSANKVGAGGIEKLYNNVKTFHDTFRKNADVALKLSDNFDRSQIPLLNSAILKGQTSITGNPDASRLLTAINTVASEYARLTSSPGATGSVISDSARHEAQGLLAAWQNQGTIRGLLDPDTGIMSIDANNRVQALEDRRNNVRGIKSDNASNPSSNSNESKSGFSHLWN